LFPSKRNIRDAFYFAQITSALGLKHHTILYDENNKEQDVFITNNLINKIKSFLTEENNFN